MNKLNNKSLKLFSFNIFIKIIPVLLLFISINCGDGASILYEKKTHLSQGISLNLITVTPDNNSVPIGVSVQYTATGTYSDGTTANITTTVTWTSSATSVATINASGLATGVAVGTSTITATQSAINNSKTLTVSATWMGSITITIDSTKVASDLTDFPVLIALPNNASLMGNAKPDGSDILFKDETMTKLDHEIEKYDNSTGELVAWVRVPLLSSSTDTDIHLYYGNPSSPDQSNKTGVWDANYLTVLHMNNDPAVPGVDQIKDSSLNSNHFSNDYGLTSEDSVDAYIGKGLNMVAKPIQRSGALSQPSSVTLSAWVNFIGVLEGKGGGEVFNISNVWGIRLSDIWSGPGLDAFYWYQSDISNWNGIVITPPAPTCAGTGWHHVVATFDNIGKTQKLYVDGILKASDTLQVSVFYEWSHLTCIGKHSDNDLYDYNGTIDETRISDIPRSEEWIQTEYNNQSSPSTFYSVW